MTVLTADDIKTIARFSQSQASLSDQLRLLHDLANRVGLHDAADYVQRGIVPELVEVPIDETTEEETVEDVIAKVVEKVEAYGEENRDASGITNLSPALTDELVAHMEAIQVERAVEILRYLLVVRSTIPAQTPAFMTLSSRLSRIILSV